MYKIPLVYYNKTNQILKALFNQVKDKISKNIKEFTYVKTTTDRDRC